MFEFLLNFIFCNSIRTKFYYLSLPKSINNDQRIKTIFKHLLKCKKNKRKVESESLFKKKYRNAHLDLLLLN